MKSINEKLKNVDKQQPNHQNIREQLLKQKRLFTERLEQSDCVLTPSEERRLIEIDEAIEAIDLAIDYQNNSIHRRETDVQQSIRTSQVRQCVGLFSFNIKSFFVFRVQNRHSSRSVN